MRYRRCATISMGKPARPPNRTEQTPSGITIDFWDDTGVDGKPQQRRYRVDGERMPSVSTVAGIYEKYGLVPAAVKLTEIGILELVERGRDLSGMTQDQLREQMLRAGLHYDSVWQRARDRGDAAHAMLLELLRDRKIPKLSEYEPDLRPWISAGMRWAMHADPKVLGIEQMVASPTHGFAGRYDLYCLQRNGRTARIDFKTVTEWKVKRDHKGNPTDNLLPPYDENLIALAGYELAAPESGYEPSDEQLIVRLGPDGDYDVTESWAQPEHFLAALTAYTGKKSLSKPRPQLTLADA